MPTVHITESHIGDSLTLSSSGTGRVVVRVKTSEGAAVSTEVDERELLDEVRAYMVDRGLARARTAAVKKGPRRPRRVAAEAPATSNGASADDAVVTDG